MEDRGRSREPREGDSYGSYSSAGDDESYEPMSDQILGYKHSTEYESESDGSYSAMSEDEPRTPGTSEYETIEEDTEPPTPGSADVYESDDKTEDYEDSFGEFKVNEIGFNKNKKNNKGSADKIQSINSGEEEVKVSEKDDDLFWKRYGYSQQMGNLGDGELKNSFGDDNSSSGSRNSSSRSGNNDGGSSNFDDGDTFKDELYSKAFPSIARMCTEDSADKTDLSKRSGAGGGNFVEKMKGWFTKCGSLLDCSDVFQGKFKWYIIGGIIVICIGVILAIALPKNGKDNSATNDTWLVDSMTPTASPLIPSTSTPTLPPGQVMDAIMFFVLIPNGKEDSITEEELEIEFSAAFDILAPQVLLNTTELNNENKTNSRVIQENQTLVVTEKKVNDSARLRGRRRRDRRKLEAISVKVPVLVHVIEIGMLNMNK
jgi:hypothetical protein